MLKVLIVDDEPIHRRGLTNMIKGLRPDYSVSDAKNGVEAIKYLNHNQVDLLITDIQMPIMDGLQLIEKLVESGKKIKIVILSVYGYFDYAQKAIALGAFDYILKPVDEITVDKVLKKVEKSLLLTLVEEHEKQGTDYQLKDVIPDHFEYKMNKLIYGIMNNSEYEEISNIFPCKDDGVVIISELYKYDLSNEYNGNEEIKLSIKCQINGLLNTFGTSISFFLQDETNSIVSIVDTPCIDNLSSEDSVNKFNELIDKMKVEYGFSITIGVGRKYDNFFNGVSQSFKDAKKSLGCMFFTGKGKVIFYDEINIIQDYQLTYDEKKEELTSTILKLDKKLSNQLIENIFFDILKDGYPKVDRFINNIANFLEDQIKTIDKKLNTTYSKQLSIDINVKLYKCNDLKELKELVYHLLSNFIDILYEQKNNKNVAAIEICKKYIEEHYMEDISLNSVAQVFYFNSSYFSNLFKNYTDMNFCEYLCKIRMDNAKRILHGTSYKIYEVSKMSGYQDPKYFNRVFKKQFGMTPDEYRRILVKDNLKI